MYPDLDTEKNHLSFWTRFGGKALVFLVVAGIIFLVVVKPPDNKEEEQQTTNTTQPYGATPSSTPETTSNS